MICGIVPTFLSLRSYQSGAWLCKELLTELINKYIDILEAAYIRMVKNKNVPLQTWTTESIMYAIVSLKSARVASVPL